MTSHRANKRTYSETPTRALDFYQTLSFASRQGANYAALIHS